MDALQRWQERVLTYRSERGKPDEQIWQNAAGWYDRWVAHNNYVTLVLPKLLPMLSPTSRVLEVGPGTGAFTLPVARSVAELIAVEPSRHMAAILQSHLEREGIGNVRLLPLRIEDAIEDLQGPFDLALASHSLYNVLPIHHVVGSLVRLATWTVILTGTGEEHDWYRELHFRFKGRRPQPPGSFRELYPILLEMGIYADVEILRTSSNYVFAGEDEMVDWWAERFQVEEERKPDLRAALLALAERRDGLVGIYAQSRTALITIHRERNLFASRWDF
ncbi:MAG: class I SAM-dependent methyltransferase [Anaerolineae bacterium]